jgi:DNA-binding NarL/FixJ family response regulator
MMPRVVRVAIVEDQAQLREGLAELVSSTEGYACSGRYRSMEEALAGLTKGAPDIMLVDIGLPGMSGLEGIRVLKQQHPGLLAIMLTIHDDDARIVEAICAGACGYLLKNTPTGKLLEALQSAMDGGAPMSPEVARRVVELFRLNPPPPQVEYNLTPHETRLLKMLVDGHNYKTAAVALSISVNTVSFHMRRIYDKLQVHSKSAPGAQARRRPHV